MFGRSKPTSTCLVCGSRIEQRDERMSVRGGAQVHRRCATYRMRRDRPASRVAPHVRILRSDD